MMGWVAPRRGVGRWLFVPIRRLGALSLTITAPTLVIAGEEDPGCAPVLFRETAAGIPRARLVLREGIGHPVSGPRFRRDLSAFLLGGDAA